ncbi:metal ABC transporter permease [Neomoorella thermoacetica]|uniref:Manganese transport system membrane protein MntB n=3 Tax=Neomoorella thermoacetica TaxID=1525 RepID=A0A1D7X9R7_NEOTH|nr:metal ABC transporter permease [Moorella thermoacetica]AKX96328.1 manganese transport system membrane protein MntB [Moorella thermoacetica]AOQ23596.1 Manganese transport system membrane protein MntB [Moorella thermoacetica]APC08050.1 manganese transport system membrane protein MntB [Moorella thermoacetica]OIQ09665.1 manganese transport system membrane protein MntB [Moorella thermoacetica]OIQ54889.1 manganese transport system membrane protein MntB [Moorella thermoacetica]
MAVWGYAFFQRALAAGLLVGLVCALVSFFVVLKRLAFIGTGIAHSTFGGLALGLALGVNPLVPAGAVALVTAWSIGLLSQKGHLHEDTAIGIVFSAAMALGVVILGFYRGYGDVFSYLFGNILAVTGSDLMILAVSALLVTAFIAFFFRDLLALAFDEETARATGLPVTPLYLGLLTGIALAVVVAVKSVGIILASALLVIPAATGYQLADNYRSMLLFTLGSSLLAVMVGLFLSFYLNLPSGAAIVLVATLFFLFSLIPGRRKGLG